MNSIHQIVKQALRTGYLSIHSENTLRQLLQTTSYGLEELRAFTQLQAATMDGWVRQESRERFCQRELEQAA